MMGMLKTINDKMCGNPVPSFTQSYASTVRGPTASAEAARNQGQPHYLRVPRDIIRERSPSVKRGINDTDNYKPSKKRNVEKTFTGSRTSDKIRKIKSPPVDIFVYGIPKDTTKEAIVDDLAESDIQVSTDDIVLMSKGNPTVVSFKISVKAEDLNKALDPSVWPLRVKVREFIHYRVRRNPDMRQNLRQDMRQNSSQQPDRLPSSDNREIRKSGNVFNFLENDVPA